MMNARKFLFDTDFESFDSPPPAPAAEEVVQPEEEVVPAEEELPPEPTFSQEDLANAHAEGFQQGHQQGRQEGFNEASATMSSHQTQALQVIADSLSQLMTGSAQQLQKSEEIAVATALAVIEKMLPNYSRKHGFGEVETLVRSCLQNLQEEPRVVIRVADALLDELQAQINGIASGCGFEGKIVLLADEELGLGDVRIEWADGGAERDSQRLWQEINDIMGHVLNSADLPAEPEDLQAPTNTPEGPEEPETADAADASAAPSDAPQPAIDAFDHLPEFQDKRGDAPLPPETPPSPQPATFEEALSTADGSQGTEPTGQPQQRS
ncbi:hypothetical protein ACTL6U_04205 [Rhodovibrionaceae bacterium A322]